MDLIKRGCHAQEVQGQLESVNKLKKLEIDIRAWRDKEKLIDNDRALPGNIYLSLTVLFRFLGIVS